MVVMLCISGYFVFAVPEKTIVAIPHSDFPQVKPLAILYSMRATCQSLKTFVTSGTSKTDLYLQNKLSLECDYGFNTDFEAYISEYIPFDDVIINYEPQSITSSVYLLNFAKNIRTVTSDNDLCFAIEWLRTKAGLGNFKCTHANEFHSRHLLIFSQQTKFDKTQIANLQRYIRDEGKVLVQFLEQESVANIQSINGLDILPITDPKTASLIGAIVTKTK
ncbi:hypothetical protein HDV01_002419 [Terramyces sp. JEL0728]|nr:hypothetical protein HDV01_002419 [Terramyces sp. JEL0728]